ncbi:MAG: L-2-amino-thiazoline-4-carboxylic acid hydrolase [Candidatus Marinimicrobia bacterium]|nr:L-2-amino-thiazoline-4-carboxylic acid hydrolase [Candidatus Neomarinimicrobiota bacterium]
MSKYVTRHDFYTSISTKMMREHELVFKWTKVSIADHFSKSIVKEIERESRELYTSTFLTLPYIGGKRSNETINVIMGGIIISMIRPLKERGLNEREIGKIIYESFEGYFLARPKILRAIIGKLLSTKYAISRMKKQIEGNSRLNYENNFKMETIEPQYEEFEFGYNYTSCTLCKMFEDNELKEYHKYMCLGDFALFNSFGVGFKRTSTIAHGAPICDFRFIKKGKITNGWPPEKLAEWVDQE